MTRRLFPLGLAAAVATSTMACDFTPPDDGRPRLEAKEGERPLALGTVSRVVGSPFFTVPIQQAARGGGSYSSAGDVERNRIIVDGRNGSSRMLLPDNSREIVRWIGGDHPGAGLDLGLKPAGRDDRPAPNLYAAVVTSPAADRETRRYDLLLGRFDTGQQVWAARGLDGVGDLWLDESGRLAVVLHAGGRTRYRLYDPAALTPLVESELAFNP